MERIEAAQVAALEAAAGSTAVATAVTEGAALAAAGHRRRARPADRPALAGRLGPSEGSWRAGSTQFAETKGTAVLVDGRYHLLHPYLTLFLVLTPMIHL
ncbi:hypothetical protein GUJ93_ZPchr0013g37254 [Zizania palustris]|uniref:Uncharacterized protein n=1 Tax=Zizania palustris TaxID=103762 RepID=A0A8J5WWQ3_ZIZPA|nr:hypothetical protein GUJ93_ZPchr0013g37254 [Zizania palustris]